MYWTDWGQNPKIERAFMDGQERQVVIGENLVQPNGITIDYESQRVYWCDSGLNVIEYSSVDGTGRTTLDVDSAGLGSPFSLTIGGSILFWTDFDTSAIYATHKIHGNDSSLGSYSLVYADFENTPAGIEVVSPGRQPNSRLSMLN